MDAEIVHQASCTYVRGKAGHALVNSERDLVDLIGFCGEHRCERLLLFAENLPQQFLDLKSGEAGMVLQKFANYPMKVAAVIPAAAIRGKFSEFVLETNRGGQFRIFQSTDQAERWLVAD